MIAPRTVRRGLHLATAACLLAGVLAALTARPVAAADAFGVYSVTYDGTAVGRGGGIGASGGLVTFAGGPGDVSGRLDAAPSAAAQASSIEPGTMARLVAGQANDQAGERVVGEPTTARAEFPGEVGEEDATQADTEQAGPLRVVGGRGHAVAAADRSVARADVATLELAGQGAGGALAQSLAAWRAAWTPGPRPDGGAPAGDRDRGDDNDAPSGDGVPGVDAPLGAPNPDDQPKVQAAKADPAVLEVVGAFGEGRAVAAQPDGTVTGDVEVGAAAVRILDQVVLRDVVGTADVGAEGEDRTAASDLTVGAATVGGVPVRVTERGVVVGEEQIVPGKDVDAATKQLNTALEQAGITVRLLPASTSVEDTRASADSGGIGIHVRTPAAPGVPRNDLEVVVGRARATVFAEPPGAGGLVGSTPLGDLGDSTSTLSTGTGSAPTPGSFGGGQATVSSPGADAAPPEVAPQASAPTGQEPGLMVAGRRVSKRTAYAGFAAWLLFTSTIPMLGTTWLRRQEAPA